MIRRTVILLYIFLCICLNLKAQVPYDLAILEASPKRYITPGTYAFRVSVENTGTNFITDLTYNFSINNGPVVSGAVSTFEVNNSATLFSNVKSRFIMPVPASFPTTGTYILKGWCTNLNGSILDQNHLNDTSTIIIKVLPYVPVKNVMIDYYTHTLCGPCGTQGDPWMDTMLTHFPDDAHKLGIHRASSDPFTTVQSTQLDQDMNVYAHPTFYFDRFKFPYFEELESATSYIYFAPWKPVRDRLEYSEAIDVDIINVQFNPVTRVLEFDVKTEFFDDYNSNLALNAYLVEDSLFYYQAGAPNPNNYYHRYVFRKSLGDVFGIPGSLPSLNPAGSNQVYSFSDVIPLNWDIDHLYIYGLVQSPGLSYLERPVLNMRSLKIADFLTGLNENSEQISSVNIYPAIASNSILVNIISDDNFSLNIMGMDGKLISVYPNYVNQKNFEIDISLYPSGMYSVIMQAGKNIYSRRFIKQ